MPLEYRIDSDQRVVTITGDYADAEGWRAMLSAVLHDPAYRPGFSFLRDLRESAHPVSSHTVMAIVAVVREYWTKLGAHRAAIVTRRAGSDPAVIAHALAEYEHLPLKAFNSYDEAMAWLREGRSDP